MRLGLNPDYNHNPNKNSYNQTRENMTKRQPRFFVPTEEAKPTNAWKWLLADSIKHWKRVFSAQWPAETLENESRFPASFQAALKHAELNLELVFGFPGNQVSPNQLVAAENIFHVKDLNRDTDINLGWVNN
jgi:hypothetical protein